MKKTLIALAVLATSSVGVAHAALGNFASGTLDQTVNIGGVVTQDEFNNKWEWAVGSGLDNYQNKVKEIQSSGGKYVLSVTNTTDAPILVGRTTEAFAVPGTGGYGAIPLIAFSDADGGTVALKADSNPGKYYFDLPVSSDGQNIGTARVHATAVAIKGVGGNSGSEGELFSVWAEANHIFAGGIGVGYSSQLSNASQAASIVNSFGGMSDSDLLKQIDDKNSNIQSLTPQTDVESEDMNYDDGTVVAASYALGIAANDKIDVTFNDAVTKTTQWTAPLHITVSYN